MKEFILLIGHGSRDDDGNQEFIEFVDAVRKELPNRDLEASFLEFADPDIDAGIEACVLRGATRIVAVPVILLAASHVKLEIPEFLERGRLAHPGVEIVYGRNVGLHEAILGLLLERFREELAQRKVANAELKDTAIVLMGRGSSDPDANGDLYKIARMLWERAGVITVETCFSGITTPLLPEGVKRTIALGAKRVVVIPFFLFTGVLIKRMHGVLDEIQSEYPKIPMTMAGYFGFHRRLVDVLVDRIEEAATARAFMNCDFCGYRPYHANIATEG